MYKNIYIIVFYIILFYVPENNILHILCVLYIQFI